MREGAAFQPGPKEERLWEAVRIQPTVIAMASNLLAMAFNLIVMASNLTVMASNLLLMAFIVMASKVVCPDPGTKSGP